MAPKRRVDKRIEGLSTDGEAWLRCEPCGFFEFKSKEALRELWEAHGESIVDEHAAEFPGTRPARWWQFDAPRSPRGTYLECFYDGALCEPRERLGGIGTPQHEVLCYVPAFAFGIPAGWIDEGLVAYYGPAFKGVAIDPEDPPLFESHASYLGRHGLFLPGERKRLTKADWEPEALQV